MNFRLKELPNTIALGTVVNCYTIYRFLILVSIAFGIFLYHKLNIKYQILPLWTNSLHKASVQSVSVRPATSYLPIPLSKFICVCQKGVVLKAAKLLKVLWKQAAIQKGRRRHTRKWHYTIHNRGEKVDLILSFMTSVIKHKSTENKCHSSENPVLEKSFFWCLN